MYICASKIRSRGELFIEYVFFFFSNTLFFPPPLLLCPHYLAPFGNLKLIFLYFRLNPILIKKMSLMSGLKSPKPLATSVDCTGES